MRNICVVIFLLSTGFLFTLYGYRLSEEKNAQFHEITMMEADGTGSSIRKLYGTGKIKTFVIVGKKKHLLQILSPHQQGFDILFEKRLKELKRQNKKLEKKYINFMEQTY